MNYDRLNETIVKKVMKALALINNPEIDPEIRQLNQEILFREVGSAIYAKVYNMSAFDFEIEYSKGSGIDERYFGLAKVASGSVATGSLGLALLVRNYLDATSSKAQLDASVFARQSGKRTRVIRSVNSETCEWCRGLAKNSPYEGDQIKPQIFARHRGCDCSIVTEGFRSRNGLLGNYVKPSDT